MIRPHPSLARGGESEDWSGVAGRLRGARAGDETDDLIWRVLDALCAATEIPHDACDVLLRAAELARDDSAQANLGGWLAALALPAHADIVDVLVERAKRWRAHAFLGPEALSALGALAERSPLARAELGSFLLRLEPGDDRYLLVRAAKVIARVECLGFDTQSRNSLAAWTDHPDYAVSAEARHQLAVVSLYDTLRADSVGALRDGLAECAVLFGRAELSDECRVDSEMLGALVRLYLAVLDAAPGSFPPVIGDAARRMRDRVLEITAGVWVGFASAEEAAFAYRVWRIADALGSAEAMLSGAEEWTNFDAALVELAAVVALVGRPQPAPGAGLADALQSLGNRVTVPALGDFLGRVVGRVRLRRVIDNYDVTGAEPARREVLAALHERAVRGEYVPGGTDDAAPAAVTAELARSPAVQLAIDHPGCFGEDPSIDEAARFVLGTAYGRLGADFPKAKWQRFVDVVVFVLRIAQDLTDLLTDFVLCMEDGGKGQTADEGDLQRHVFRRLAEKYGRGATWEKSPIAGGRADSGVKFEECEIPIECKAEYHDVGPSHVDGAYLEQVDGYATSRDRLALLLVLDLRRENAGGHQVRRRAARKAGEPDGPGAKAYSLREGFRTTGLAPDPQLPDPRLNAVVVGLFRGNRPKPSSTTQYSKKPRGSKKV